MFGVLAKVLPQLKSFKMTISQPMYDTIDPIDKKYTAQEVWSAHKKPRSSTLI